MSFQAYLTNIEAKTGKTAADFRGYAAAKDRLVAGRLRDTVKVGSVVADLKQEFALRHGHAMAIVALPNGSKQEGDA